ncbi:glycine, alanine and asparagine-rich protein-like [Pararge aegeria]|uniref:Jg18695 protein n=1 Tax=Pararge aegeria aegeria TaxID=348720 RepID=A0A8S4SCG2_9NEOP|nr:glycine, alanine and asparagine-rich protein-like [Pararge aegeria]CAH2262993.1 jg18695 [Pararge aegeria aegeria]
MAAKLIVALACFALCNASPVFLRNYIFRNGRGYSIGQGYTNTGGRATGSATSNGGVLQAYGTASSSGQNQFGRSGPFPGDTVAKAEVYDTPNAPTYGVSKAFAEAQNPPTYYAVPAPATIVSEQIFETPAEIRYAQPAVAQSSATLNGNSDSSITSAKVEGTGSAESTAKTQGIGSYGITSSNAKTFGSGVGTASSNVNNGYGAANTAARTEGFGSASSKSESGLGMTSAATQTNGGYASSAANNALNSAVVSASSQGTASSKADINTLQGVIVSPVKTVGFKGWRFGTAYSVPTPGQAQVSSQANGGSAKSTAHTDGVVTTADAQGYGSANANANLPGGYVNSAANTNGLGYGAARYTQANQYGSSHSTIYNGLGNIKSSANSNGYGNANSHADINEHGSLSSVSNSNGLGTAASSANSVPSFASLKTDGLPYIYSPRATVNTQTSGQGSASARTQGLNSGYKVVNSVANSYGHGAAQANASA